MRSKKKKNPYIIKVAQTVNRVKNVGNYFALFQYFVGAKHPFNIQSNISTHWPLGRRRVADGRRVASMAF